MANGWMFLHYDQSSKEEIEEHLQKISEQFPEADIDMCEIYRGSVMIEVPPRMVKEVEEYIHFTSDDCDVTWV